MQKARSIAGVSLSVLVVPLFAGALAVACDANVEEICLDGQPCAVGDGGGGSSGTTTTTSKTGSTTTSTVTILTEGDIPCDVFAILEAKCHICHNAAHDNGAPIDLFACSRFHEIDCNTVQDRSLTAQSYVDSDFMPLGPTDLTADEKEIMMGWLNGGAACVPAGEGCTGTVAAKGCFE